MTGAPEANVLMRARRLVLLLLGWSLPVSFFGMQAATIAGAAGLLAWVLWCRGRGFAKSPLDGAFVALLCALGASLLLAPGSIASFQSATSFWVVAAFYVTWIYLDREADLRRIVVGLAGLAGVAAALGIFQALTGSYPLTDLLHPGADPVMRLVPVTRESAAVGFFFSRLTFAHVLLFPFGWLVAWGLEPLPARRRLLVLGLATLVGVGILCSKTRAAWVGAALVVVGLMLAKLSSRRRLFALATLAALAAVLLLLVPGVPRRLQNSFAGKSDWTRLALWQTALDLSSDHPWTGVGYGNFRKAAEPLIAKRTAAVGAKRFPGVVAWAHSNWLTFLAEMGIAGVFAFCLLFTAYFRSAHRTLRDLPPDRLWLRGFVGGSMAGVAAFLWIGCFHDSFFDGEVAYTLWFTLAASLACRRFSAPKPEAAPCPAVPFVQDHARFAAGLMVLTVGAASLSAWGLLVYRSTSKQAPGELGFLVPLTIAAAVWILLDLGLRKLPRPSGEGARSWLWSHRHTLALFGMLVGLAVLSVAAT